MLMERARGLATDAAEAVGQTLDGAVDSAGTALRDGMDEAKTAWDETKGAVSGAVDELKGSLPGLDEVLAQAALMPGVRIERADFLREALAKKSATVVEWAITTTPAHAGVTSKELHRLAGRYLGKEARRTTVLSFAAGIPGAAAAAATIPADLIQLYGHLLRAIQMLSYLYGWRDTCHVPEGDMPDQTRLALLLFLGVMSGDEVADAELVRVADFRAFDGVGRALEGSEAMGRIMERLAARMARRATGQAVGKAVPIAGAIIAGTMSYGGFSDMWKRLRKRLEDIG